MALATHNTCAGLRSRGAYSLTSFSGKAASHRSNTSRPAFVGHSSYWIGRIITFLLSVAWGDRVSREQFFFAAKHIRVSRVVSSAKTRMLWAREGEAVTLRQEGNNSSFVITPFVLIGKWELEKF